MKVAVLLAGLIGALGFVQPFFEYGDLPVSAYRVLTGFTAEELDLDAQPTSLRHINELIQTEEWVSAVTPNERHRSPVPFYFLSAIVFIVVGGVSLIRGRFSGFAALFSLSGAMLAIGGWMRELKRAPDIAPNGGDFLMGTGSTLLLMSGLVALVSSLVVLIKREPDRPVKPPKPPEIQLPEARLLR
jgi:hypothetical protein